MKDTKVHEAFPLCDFVSSVVQAFLCSAKTGNPLAAGSPECMTLPREPSCLPNQKLESLRAGRRAGIIDVHTRRRVGRIPLRGLRRSGADMNHIRNRIPLAIELADLLLVDV